MSNVYSAPLFCGSVALSTSSADVFTVPSGHVYVVRTLTIANDTATTHAFTVRYRAAGISVDVLVRRFSLATLTVNESELWLAFREGDRLRVRSDASFQSDICVFGYDLVN